MHPQPFSLVAFNSPDVSFPGIKWGFLPSSWCSFEGTFLSESTDVFVITLNRRTFFLPENENLNFGDWNCLETEDVCMLRGLQGYKKALFGCLGQPQKSPKFKSSFSGMKNVNLFEVTYDKNFNTFWQKHTLVYLGNNKMIWRVDIIISGTLKNPVQTGFLKNVRGKNSFTWTTASIAITYLGRTQRGQSNNEIKFLFSILNTTPEGWQPYCVVNNWKTSSAKDLTAKHLGRSHCGCSHSEMVFQFYDCTYNSRRITALLCNLRI